MLYSDNDQFLNKAFSCTESVYRKVNWGNDGLQFRYWLPGGIVEADPRKIALLLGAKEISMLCGGSAHFLAIILRHCGFDASVYNYGVRGVSTHVVTVVWISQSLVILDATFNHVLKIGNSYDAVEIFEDLMNNGGRFIKRQRLGAELKRRIFFNPNSDCFLETLNYYKNTKIIQETSKGYSLLTGAPYTWSLGDLSFLSYLRRNQYNIEIFIRERQAYTSVMQLMLFPINLPSFSTGEANVEFNKIKALLDNEDVKNAIY